MNVHLNSTENIKLFKKKFGSCDVLLTQFSYASWKGGKNNHACSVMIFMATFILLTHYI